MAISRVPYINKRMKNKTRVQVFVGKGELSLSNAINNFLDIEDAEVIQTSTCWEVTSPYGGGQLCITIIYMPSDKSLKEKE